MRDNTQRQRKSLSEFINEALYDEHNGYYSTGQVKFGPDFVTFAEKWAPLLAERFFLMWKAMREQDKIDAEETFHIYEFGAGSGKMALRILEFIHGMSCIKPRSEWPDFFKAVKYVIGEISPELLAQQRSRLKKYLRAGKAVCYLSDARESDQRLPRGVGVVLSNELIDAIPPQEITINPNGDIYATVVYSNRNTHSLALAPYKEVLSPDELGFVDAIIEQSKELRTLPCHFYIQPGIARFYKSIAEILEKGYVVTLDYGSDARAYLKNQRSLRTFSHQLGNNTPFFENKGRVDITVDVNFSDLSFAGQSQGCEVAYYGIQNAVGGPFQHEFRILFQRRNLSSDLDSTVFAGMLQSSPVCYHEMSPLVQTLSPGEKLFSKLRNTADQLLTKVTSDQWRRNKNEKQKTEELITSLNGTLQSFLKWLGEQNYLKRDKAFMIDLHFHFSTLLVDLLSIAQFADFSGATSFLKIFENATDCLTAEYFLVPLIDRQLLIINEKDPNEVRTFTLLIKAILPWMMAMKAMHPGLYKRIFKQYKLEDYNLNDNASKEAKENSLLGRCLKAADEDNLVAVKKINLDFFIKSAVDQEIQSSKFIVRRPLPNQSKKDDSGHGCNLQ